MKKVAIVIVILIVAFLLFLGLSGQNNNSSPKQDETESTSQRDKAPNFQLEDFSSKIVSSEDFEGKALVINSWATWCPFCKDELPDFIELQEEFENEIVVIAIDRSESLEKAKGYTDENNITDDLVYLLDPSDSFYQSIGGFSMPETIFVNIDGEIVFHKRGPMQLSEMREKVEETLNS